MAFIRGVIRLFGVAILILFVLGLVIFFAVQPTEELDLSVSTTESPETGAILMQLMSGSESLDDQLTDLAKQWVVRLQNKETWPSSIEITGVKLDFAQDTIGLKAAISVFDFFRLGPEVRLTPLFAGDRLGLHIVALKLGRLPLPRQFLIERFLAPALEEENRGAATEAAAEAEQSPVSITLEGETIWISGLLDQLPPALSLTGMTINDGRLDLDFGLNPDMAAEALTLIHRINFNRLEQKVSPESLEAYRRLAEQILTLDPARVDKQTVMGIWNAYERLDQASQTAVLEQLVQDVGEERLDAFVKKYLEPGPK